MLVDRGTAIGTVISSGGTLSVTFGGTASGALLESGGTM